MSIADTVAHNREQQAAQGSRHPAPCAHARPTPPHRAAESRTGVHAGRGREPEAEIDWSGYTFEYLIKRVLEKQHASIREQLSGIRRESARPGAPSEPAGQHIEAEVRTLVDDLAADLAEEESVFPELLQLEQAYVGERPGYKQHLRSVLDRLSRRNDRHLRVLDGIRREAASAVTSARKVHEGQLCCRLGLLQMALLDHLHLEHDIIFPRAASMEAEMFRHRH